MGCRKLSALALVTLFVNLCIVLPVFAGQCTLAWDANSEPDVAGYKMYYGQSTRVYGPPTPINVGNVVTYTVTGLTGGVTYYFAVTAYDTFGNESGYSNEVFYAPPAINRTITVTAGPGGTVSQSGAIPVMDGSDFTVTSTPSTGYHNSLTTIDGSGFGNQAEYTFSNVTADHTINFAFALNTYDLTITAGSGGTITCSNGTSPVPYGSNVTCTISPNSGKRIASLWVDGLPKVITTLYSFPSVGADHTISVNFADIKSSSVAVCSAGFCYVDMNGNGKWDGETIDELIHFGITGDKSIFGDWDGDGAADIGVFRPSNTTFYLKKSTGTAKVVLGSSTDLPLSGDWDGNGLWNVGVFRPSNATFYLNKSGGVVTIPFGSPTDLPITGDWDGDGIWDVGVFKPSTVTFSLKKPSETTTIRFGLPTDLPISGDWDGNGIWEIGVFRPSTATFYLKTLTGTVKLPFGMSGMTPVIGW